MAIIDFDSHLRDGWFLTKSIVCPSLSPNTGPGGSVAANCFTPGSSMTSLQWKIRSPMRISKTGASMGQFVNRKGIYRR